MQSLHDWSLLTASIATGLGAFLALGLPFLYFIQEKFLYRSGNFCANRHILKNSEGYRHPSDRGIPCENIEITTEDGVILRGWFLHHPHKSTVPTVIFFQGSGGNIGSRMNTFELLYKQLGVNVVAVSYRGYGDSEGEPSETGLQMDIKAVVKFTFLQAGIDTGKVIVQGRSLGGATAIYAVWSSEYPVSFTQIKGLIIENTFTSVSDLVSDRYPHIAAIRHILLRNYWPSEQRIASITCPVLFVSGEADELIPPNHMHRLYESAVKSSRRVFVRNIQLSVPNGTHRFTWTQAGPTYLSSLLSFLSTCLNHP